MAKRIIKYALWILAFGVFLASVVLFGLICQMVDTGTSIDSLVYTMNAGLDGTNPSTVIISALPYLPRCLLLIAIMLMLVGVCHMCLKRVDVVLRINRKAIRLTSWLTAFVLILQLVISPALVYVYADKKLLLSHYLFSGTTQLYEDYYVPVTEVNITAPEKKKNLVFIWLESMENTYSDAAHGGAQQTDLISGLNALGEDNVSFAGMHAVPYARYTFGAMFAAMSGTPYAFSIAKNNRVSQVPAESIPFLNDILKDNGYVSEYMCGSDSNFAGTKQVLLGHGFDKVYDLQTARDEGFVPEDYYVNWGLEDSKVYEVARQEITALSEGGEPFCFMFSTMDTHFPIGYVCDECGHEYEDDTANVVSCADRQITEFVSWLSEQTYYEDTVIFICGDHPRMDTHLVQGVDFVNRTLYNCYINADKEHVNRNRICTQFDTLPTVLSALGFDIEGSRIGFGTDLFSDIQTIPEQTGLEYFETELQKHSEYFINYMQ